MKIGSLVKQIRQSKKIPTETIYRDIMSKSMYYKFENSKNDITSSNLLIILDRLNMSLKEFEYLIHDGLLPAYQESFQRMYSAIYRQDVDDLQELHQSTKLNQKKKLRTEDRHLQTLVELYIEKLSGQPLDSKKVDIIKTYLLKCDSWYYYEWSLFNNSIFIFDVATIDALFDQTFNNLETYESHNALGNESVLFVANLLSLLIQQQQIELANKYLKSLNLIKVPETAVFETILIKFYNKLLLGINSHKSPKQDVLNLISIFLKLNLKPLYASHQKLLDFVLQTYSFDK
ncbi:transcriptional regulator [Paucilactobacillus hokkaidonensis JCM 18461]|uniref:Transcriptional regulator n=3 Tax=Paucilactobacillus hokkaidonensis TaxID=1193095 RepID=A0A0A1GTQ0_9LACO|nr:Rgg/GadR/MutR family transcriptional regulator [Paucilactobacillus hokkaidonensis]BAP85380.1 transcriptional regulator [Paucilactobacillus hokkaidonensis JCM 18461]